MVFLHVGRRQGAVVFLGKLVEENHPVTFVGNRQETE